MGGDPALASGSRPSGRSRAFRAGLFVAYALARWRFPGKFLVDGLVHLPLVLPPVVTGYILLLLFGRRGPIGAFLYEHFGIVFFVPLDGCRARGRA